jgi:hypothetical protein
MLRDKFRKSEKMFLRNERKLKNQNRPFIKAVLFSFRKVSGLLFFYTPFRPRYHPNHVQRQQLYEISMTTFHKSSNFVKHVGLCVQQPRGKVTELVQADAALFRIPRTIIWSTYLNTLKTIGLDRRWSAWDSNRVAPRSTTDAELSPTTFVPNLIKVLVRWSV